MNILLLLLIKYVAAIMILMENRDSAIYNCIFQWLIKKAPSISTKEIHIMTDFEKATFKSLKENFKNAKIHGCYFHFVHVIHFDFLKITLTNSLQICLHIFVYIKHVYFQSYDVKKILNFFFFIVEYN